MEPQRTVKCIAVAAVAACVGAFVARHAIHSPEPSQLMWPLFVGHLVVAAGFGWMATSMSAAWICGLAAGEGAMLLHLDKLTADQMGPVGVAMVVLAAAVPSVGASVLGAWLRRLSTSSKS